MLVKLARLTTVNLMPPLIGLAGIPLLARLFQPDVFGEYFIAFTVASVLAVALSGMFHQAMFNMRESDQLVEHYRICLLFIGAAALGLGAVYVLATLLAGFKFPVAEGLLVILFGALLATSATQSSYLVNSSQLRMLERIIVVRPCLVLSSQVLASHLTTGLAGLLIPAIASEIVVCVAAHRLGKTRHNGCGERWLELVTHIAQHKKALTFLMPSQLTPLLANLAPAVMLQQAIGTGGVGLYSMTMRIVGTPINALTAAIRSVFWLEVRGAPDVRARVLRNCAVIFACGSAAFVCLIQLQPPLARYVLGEPWAGVDRLIPLAVGWMTTSVSLSFATEVLKNSERQADLLLGELIASFVKIGGLLTLCLVFPNAALYGWFVVASCANFGLLVLYLWRLR